MKTESQSPAWYLLRRGEISGPFSLRELEGMVARGAARFNHLATRNPKSDHWIAVEKALGKKATVCRLAVSVVALAAMFGTATLVLRARALSFNGAASREAACAVQAPATQADLKPNGSKVQPDPSSRQATSQVQDLALDPARVPGTSGTLKGLPSGEMVRLPGAVTGEFQEIPSAELGAAIRDFEADERQLQEDRRSLLEREQEHEGARQLWRQRGIDPLQANVGSPAAEGG